MGRAGSENSAALAEALRLADRRPEIAADLAPIMEAIRGEMEQG
jgi:hypothetical protein